MHVSVCREKERETLEGDNLFTSEASSAAFFPPFLFWALNQAVAGPPEGSRNHLVCSDHSEIILKIHRLNLPTFQERLRRIRVI